MLSLFRVSFITVLISAIGWFYLSRHAQTKVYPVRTVPFYQNNFDIVAHRGGSFEAPENTLTAFEHAASLNENIVLEMDVYMTADKQVVVFHDEKLDRVTNGSGPIYNKTLNDLKKLDAGYNFKGPDNSFPFRGKGIQIPTLKEVLEKFKNKRIVIELKQKYPELAFSVYETLKDFNSISTTVISSEYNQPLNYLRKMDPRFFFSASQDEVLRTGTLLSLKLEGLDPMKPDAYFIPIKYGKIPVLTDELIAETHKRGKKIYVWTINDVSVAKELQKRGVDGIFTDKPSEMLEAFKN